MVKSLLIAPNYLKVYSYVSEEATMILPPLGMAYIGGYLRDKGVEVKIAGTEIVVSAADIELAGITASKIENLCRITNRDRRIFQDGCYITQKAGKQ